MRKYAVVYTAPTHAPGGASNWCAYVPDLPGCVAAADTRKECEILMAEAIPFHIEGMRQAGEFVPLPTTWVELLEVAA